MGIFEIFDEEPDPQGDVSATLGDVLKTSADAANANLRVAMPATVVKYNKDKQLVDVQPEFKRKYSDGAETKMPILYSVPVAFPRSGSAFIALPIKKGDHVMLIMMDRSIDIWKTSGGEMLPGDSRNHDLSDAVAYPGMYPFSKAVKLANSDDIIIGNSSSGGKLEIRIKPNNHIQIFNNGQELIKVLNDFVSVVREAVVYTSTGAQKLRHSDFEEVQTKLKTFLEG